MPRNFRRRAAWLAATLLAFVAAVGGGTYALWSASQVFTGGTITAGSLDLQRRGDAVTWYDVSPDRQDGKVTAPNLPVLPTGAVPGLAAGQAPRGHAITLTNWNMVPGDTILGIVPLTAVLTGDNLVAGLSFSPSLGAAPWESELSGVSVQFYLKPVDDVVLATAPIARYDGTPFAYLAARPQGGWGDGNDLTYVVSNTGDLAFDVLVVVSLADTVTNQDHAAQVVAALDGGSFVLTQVREVGQQYASAAGPAESAHPIGFAQPARLGHSPLAQQPTLASEPALATQIRVTHA